MRNPSFLLFAWIVLAALAGCATEQEPQRSPVRLGMSRDDLQFFLGKPLRIEKTESGEEYWFYRCVSPATPAMDGAVSQDPYESSATVSISIPTTRNKEECAIHVSADGHVIEPIPEAKINP